MKHWVDPPEGWKYGFPKIWDKSKDSDWETWLTKNGYPRDLINQIPYVRMWKAKDDEKI
jgi:hypothetical protein